MGDINGESGMVGPVARARCSVKSMGKVGLQLEFRSSSDVRASARISFRSKVKCGSHQ